MPCGQRLEVNKPRKIRINICEATLARPVTMRTQTGSPKRCERSHDLISELPEGILHEILSSLSFKETVRTCVLSKRWRYLWTSHPNLYFNFRGEWRKRSMFLSFINRGLLASPEAFSVINYLQICYPFIVKQERVDIWVAAALKRQVKSLDLAYCASKRDDLYNSTLFSGDSLERLYLNFFDGGPVPTQLNMPNLKVLHLANMAFLAVEPDADFFKFLPSLEELIIQNCDLTYLVCLNICCQALRILVIEYCIGNDRCEVYIDAPLLLVFKNHCHFMAKKYTMGRMSSLEHVEIDLGIILNDSAYLEVAKLFRGISWVESLDLTHCSIEVLFPVVRSFGASRLVFSWLTTMSFTIYLRKDCIEVFSYLVQSSPKLDTLIIKFPDLQNNQLWSEELLSYQFNLDCLKTIEIFYLYEPRDQELEFIKYLVIKANKLEKIVPRGRFALLHN